MIAAPHPGVFVDPEEPVLFEQSPALFLDRDGVVNVDHGYVSTPSDTEWVDGIFDLCRGAQQLGYRLLVVTNQAGIARGYYSEAQFLDYTSWVHRVFRQHGIRLTATIYCPHHPEAGLGPLRVECPCRKPAPGMLIEAQRRFGSDLAASALVGDKGSDIAAGRAAGLRRLYKVVGAAEASSAPVLPAWRLTDVLDDLKSHCP